MPYSYPSNIPTAAKNLPSGAQKLFIGAANGALRSGATEENAIFAGWHAVKTKYKKGENNYQVLE